MRRQFTQNWTIPKQTPDDRLIGNAESWNNPLICVLVMTVDGGFPRQVESAREE